MVKRYRAAAIGSTGKGNFGHGLDMAFKDLEGVDFVALADDDPRGLEAAGKRTGVKKLYADYREMLVQEKPDLVSVGPHWVNRQVEIIGRGEGRLPHLLREAARRQPGRCRRHARCLCQGGRQAHRRAPVASHAAGPAGAAGLAGRATRPAGPDAAAKDDARGGGDLIVHGTHWMDLVDPVRRPPALGERAHRRRRPERKEDKHKATEPLGPVAGDLVAATFGFNRGVRGFFDTVLKLDRPGRTPYGVHLECAEASLLIRSPGDVFVYPANTLVPEDPKLTWQKVWVEDWHFYPDHRPRPMNDWVRRQPHSGQGFPGSDRAGPDAADERRGRPAGAGDDPGRVRFHFPRGARTAIPLKERRHPLGEV